MRTEFYDIESLSNVFTLSNYKKEDNILDIFYIIDTETLEKDFENTDFNVINEKIKTKNPRLPKSCKINLHNLKTTKAKEYILETFGFSISDNVNNKDTMEKDFLKGKFRPICDTDKEFDEEKIPYLFGYNSFNYDDTMLAQYFDQITLNKRDGIDALTNFNAYTDVSAKEMRDFNDSLFTEEFISYMPRRLSYDKNINSKEKTYSFTRDDRYQIHQNFSRSGRHIDVARLNEKQARVPLKKLLGLLGYQILESDKLENDTTINNNKEFLDLIAYNVSDVVGLAWLFNNDIYTNNFLLKRQLLKDYPECIYEQDGNTYKPDINPKKIRRRRLTIDSPSAQIAIKILCPYGRLDDIEYVDLTYPSKEQAKALGVERFNVLEKVHDFIKENFKEQPHVIKNFEPVYKFYKSVEGKNFNDKQSYKDKYIGDDCNDDKPQFEQLPDKVNYFYPYYKKDGTPTSCFVNFSLGGIHGQECNINLFLKDYADYKLKQDVIDYCKETETDPLNIRKLKTITILDKNYEYKDLLKSGITIKAMEKMTKEERIKKCYKTFKKPTLFRKENGIYKLRDEYKFTSYGVMNHEDFKSYYPLLLVRLGALVNKNFEDDRYYNIYLQKQTLGQKQKDPKISESEKKKYKIQRSGVKLILNATSGIMNAKTDNDILKANTIISMRIIGQLFSFLIGQAQTLEGAIVPSTNTDGLYTIFDEKKNNEILKSKQEEILVDIDPERLNLISKDANNRIERDPKTDKVLSAAGSLGCYFGSTPLYNPTKPPIVDYILGEYISLSLNEKQAKNFKCGLNDKFNRKIAKDILRGSNKKFKDFELLRMFQHIVSSSRSSDRYTVSQNKITKDYTPLQLHNRVFFVKDDTEDSVYITSVYASTATPKMIEKGFQQDLQAISIISNYVDVGDIDLSSKKIKFQKISNVEEDASVLIENRDLEFLSIEDQKKISDNLDLEKYIDLAEAKFYKEWYNNQTTQSENIIPQELKQPVIEEFLNMAKDVTLP